MQNQIAMSSSFQQFASSRVFRIVRYVKIVFLKDVWDLFLYFLTGFCDTEGSGGVRSGGNFRSSKDDPKSIGICPEALIRPFGIIETPKKPYINQ